MWFARGDERKGGGGQREREEKNWNKGNERDTTMRDKGERGGCCVNTRRIRATYSWVRDTREPHCRSPRESLRVIGRFESYEAAAIPRSCRRRHANTWFSSLSPSLYIPLFLSLLNVFCTSSILFRRTRRPARFFKLQLTTSYVKHFTRYILCEKQWFFSSHPSLTQKVM